MLKIDKTDENLSALQWVARAVAKNGHGLGWLRHIHVIHVENNQAVGTNGHRLHLADVHGIPDGDYEIIKNNKTVMFLEPVVDIDFVDFKRLFWPVEEATFEKEIAIDARNDWEEYIKFVREIAPVKGDYFFDLLKNQGNFKAYAKSPTSPVYFKGDKKQGLIMPIKI